MARKLVYVVTVEAHEWWCSAEDFELELETFKRTNEPQITIEWTVKEVEE